MDTPPYPPTIGTLTAAAQVLAHHGDILSAAAWLERQADIAEQNALRMADRGDFSKGDAFITLAQIARCQSAWLASFN